MKRFWIAVHLPLLPLESRAALSPPSAIVEHGRIVLADACAQDAGVIAGTEVATARTLAPTITLLAPDHAQQAAALQALACWAGAFTPHINLADDTLLLEVGSCLRLFGGTTRLATRIAQGVRELRYSAALAAAPTPLGAHWLAYRGTAALCRDATALARRLDALPLDVLPANCAQALARFGAATLGEVRRLPQPALARRIGRAPLQTIARAYGEEPDPRADFVFPQRFALELQLPAPVDSATALLFAARRLTAALAGWLAARHSGIREFSLRLLHRQRETPLALHFAEICADAQRFERVLRERLEHLALAAPVESVRLEAAAPQPLARRNRALFDDAAGNREALDALLERLGARLGSQNVQRLVEHADHRPECATRGGSVLAPYPADRRSVSAATPPRPLWLIDPPQPLAEVDGRPQRNGPLRLLAGPERIESGWWDEGELSGAASDASTPDGAAAIAALGDVRRDYFIALASDGAWLWIYRDGRPPGGWYAHGLFA